MTTATKTVPTPAKPYDWEHAPMPDAEFLYKKAVYEFMDAAGIPLSFQNRERFELEELGPR